MERNTMEPSFDSPEKFEALAEEQDSDDDEDFLPTKTTFETAAKKSKRGVPGSRGRFGSCGVGRSGPTSWRKRNAFLSASSRESLEQESGTLADDSSPEFIRSRLSEDETCDFANFSVPPDLMAARLTARPKKATLRRSNSVKEAPSTRNLFHTRSSSKLLSQQPIAKRGHQRIQRSHSLQLGFSSTQSSNDNMASLSSLNSGFPFEENEDPNDNLNDIERNTEDQRDRKKRRARRHSFLGNETASSVARTSSSSTTSSILPPDLNWLVPEASPSSKPVDIASCLHDSTLAAFSHHSASSPTAFSVASSRKRGVCGSPSSDGPDDFADFLTLSSSSMSDARRTRSRSRVFSHDEFPAAPSLARNLVAEEEAKKKHRNKREEYGGRGDAMDESSDDSSAPDSSPDTSFEMMNVVPVKVADAVPEDDTSKMKRVFDSMSSYEDLKFLIRELRRENRQPCRANFGEVNIFKVAPPVKDWTSKRRASFTTWAKEHLGFTVRSAGMGFTFVQISRARGLQLLDILEAALTEYKKVELQKSKQQQPMEVLAPSGVFTNLPPSTIKASRDSFASLESPVSAIKSPQPNDTFMGDNDADDLANQVASLTVNESKRKISLSRQVTLLPKDDRKTNSSLRLSIDSYSHSVSSSRPSMDSRGQATTDLNLHILGHSPRLPTGRPPKMSLGSICSSQTAATTTAIAGRASTTPCDDRMSAPCSTINFVRTPLMTHHRGWGSQPVSGRDWGNSCQYDENKMAKLMQHFESACGIEAALGDSFGDCPINELPKRSTNSLVFDFEADAEVVANDEDMGARKEADRKNHRRKSNFSKRKRMSLFVTATGAKVQLPRQRFSMQAPAIISEEQEEDVSDAEIIGRTERVVSTILSFFNERELISTGSLICTDWSDWATDAHANMLLSSVQETDGDDNVNEVQSEPMLEKSWDAIHAPIPWASFLAEGGAKKVYKTYNSYLKNYEAISVMDTHEIESIQIVANELAVSAMLSSLVRRAICPNFIVMRSVFTSAYPAPESHWGNEQKKHPKGKKYAKRKVYTLPTEPNDPEPGRFQYIRMELCNEGDAEELLKRQKDEALRVDVAVAMLFQIAFAIYSAADKFSVKHYDVKLLNVFVNHVDTNGENLVIRVGLGSHVFALQLPPNQAFVAKLADFGTANIIPATNGQPVAISHFTTLENTPPDFMILGDDATQGHEHDWWNLGLCMLHLFTGHRPYEEILEDVNCPPNFRKRLSAIWEDESIEGYAVIRSVILDGVDKDENGNIIEGEPDDVFYHTLYRHLVLCGIPKDQFQQKTCPRVWKAITDSLLLQAPKKGARGGKLVRKRSVSDVTQFTRDCKKFSIRSGNNPFISRAREALRSVDGGMDLLLGLLEFDPKKRSTAMHVLNSACMESLREAAGTTARSYGTARVESYLSFATQG